MFFMQMIIMKKLGDGSLLAIDGSKIHLPNAPEINDEFGTINGTLDRAEDNRATRLWTSFGNV
jgi:hypothetical protein